MQSSFGPVPARRHQPDRRNNGSAARMGHQRDWRRAHGTQRSGQHVSCNDDQAGATGRCSRPLFAAARLNTQFGGMRYSRPSKRNLSSADSASGTMIRSGARGFGCSGSNLGPHAANCEFSWTPLTILRPARTGRRSLGAD
jgi:hypothetical protein